MAFSRDGTRLLTGGQVELWDSATGQLIRSFEGFLGALSPDGTRVLTSAGEGIEGTLKRWDAKTGQLLRTFQEYAQALVDLLIHEVCIARPELLSNPFVQRVVDHHTSPREAGQVFSLAKPKLAVYSHLVFLSSDKVPRATVDDIVAGTRETYDGPLQVGEDLMSFEIGDTVIVNQRKP